MVFLRLYIIFYFCVWTNFEDELNTKENFLSHFVLNRLLIRNKWLNIYKTVKSNEKAKKMEKYFSIFIVFAFDAQLSYSHFLFIHIFSSTLPICLPMWYYITCFYWYIAKKRGTYHIIESEMKYSLIPFYQMWSKFIAFVFSYELWTHFMQKDTCWKQISPFFHTSLSLFL